MEAKNFGQELKMTQTGFLTSKSGKTFIRIYFSRHRSINEDDTAEGIIPGYKILKSDGFEEEASASPVTPPATTSAYSSPGYSASSNLLTF